jgi:hypothetical protein
MPSLEILQITVEPLESVRVVRAAGELDLTSAGTLSQLATRPTPRCSTSRTSLLLGVMAITMTVPMVAWMRYRGHGWRPSAEMSAAMLVPTAGAIALLGASVVEDLDALMLGEHVAMLLGMLVAMLLRPAEYSGRHTPSGFQAVSDNA